MHKNGITQYNQAIVHTRTYNIMDYELEESKKNHRLAPNLDTSYEYPRTLEPKAPIPLVTTLNFLPPATVDETAVWAGTLESL